MQDCVKLVSKFCISLKLNGAVPDKCQEKMLVTHKDIFMRKYFVNCLLIYILRNSTVYDKHCIVYISNPSLFNTSCDKCYLCQRKLYFPKWLFINLNASLSGSFNTRVVMFICL